MLQKRGRRCKNASIHNDSWHHKKALRLFEKAYSLRKEILGEKHPDTLKSLNNLALSHLQQNQLYQSDQIPKEAIKLFEKLIKGVENLRNSFFKQPYCQS